MDIYSTRNCQHGKNVEKYWRVSGIRENWHSLHFLCSMLWLMAKEFCSMNNE
jgi:hypothetical protein